MDSEKNTPFAEGEGEEHLTSTDTHSKDEFSENTKGEALEEVENSEESEELKEKYLRLFAEFDNYKKRVVRERLDLLKSASQDTMTALLPVLDDFERAMKNAEALGKQDDPVLEGLLLVYHKLSGILKHKGLTEMDSTGQDFDPEWHEALTEVPAPTPDLKGKVLDTVEKGYKLNDKIIRYAKVVVGN
jgi:molecular chaperone GrpE